MKKKRISMVLLASCFLLGGCATTQYQPAGGRISASAQAAESQAWQTLRRVSVESRNELRLLAQARNDAAQQSMTRQQQEQSFYQNTYVPKGFRQKVVFNYVGSARRAATAIAQIAGYKPVQFVGNAPANPIVVNIHINRRPLVNALHELGMQTGDRVKVSVYPVSRLIMFVYENRGTSEAHIGAEHRSGDRHRAKPQ